MSSLAGRVAWVTGGGTGIGAAVVEALAAAGAVVVASGRRPDPLERVAARVPAAEPLPVDITDWNSVEQAAAAIQKRHGRIDILVNGAGVNIPQRQLAALTAESWRGLVDVNLNGTFNCIRAVLPEMRARKDGLIVNVASWVGRHPERVAGAGYISAKHAVVALTHSINMEEGVNGIRASCICPAEVDTEMVAARPKPPPAEERARMLRPGDLGALVRFIAEMPPHACLNEVVISPTWNRFHHTVHPDERP